MYLAKEAVDAVKRDLSLDDLRDLIEGHQHLVPQRIKNCGDWSTPCSKFKVIQLTGHGGEDLGSS